MKLWTLSEIKAKILRDLDLEAEDFVTDTEIVDAINEGIDDAEAIIHGFGREDEYFLAKTVLALVQGQDEYSLPSDMYATKILALTYTNGSTIYPIKRMRTQDRFIDIEVMKIGGTSNDYRYLIVNNNVTDGYKINLFPPARESLPQGMVMWYVRNANRLEVDTDVCDIPEFVYYVIAFAKHKVLFKEGHPNTPEAAMELQRQKENMSSTLAEMVPDGDDELVKDFSHYEAST